MAIGERDSLKNPTSTMAVYIKDLEQRKPGIATQILSWMYTDNGNRPGIPEIALYPYKQHQGPQTLIRSCPNDTVALKMIAQEAERDNLLYLPLATFTKDGTIDMVNGYYDQRRVGLYNSSVNVKTAQHTIEDRVSDYLQQAMTVGKVFPYYGRGTLVFDTRTGFFVFNQVVVLYYLICL
jgi:hypothetical protein